MIAQCDGCGDRYPEGDLTFECLPGATLAWCDDCIEPTHAEMYGVRP